MLILYVLFLLCFEVFGSNFPFCDLVTPPQLIKQQLKSLNTPSKLSKLMKLLNIKLIKSDYDIDYPPYYHLKHPMKEKEEVKVKSNLLSSFSLFIHLTEEPNTKNINISKNDGERRRSQDDYNEKSLHSWFVGEEDNFWGYDKKREIVVLFESLIFIHEISNSKEDDDERTWDEFYDKLDNNSTRNEGSSSGKGVCLCLEDYCNDILMMLEELHLVELSSADDDQLTMTSSQFDQDCPIQPYSIPVHIQFNQHPSLITISNIISTSSKLQNQEFIKSNWFGLFDEIFYHEKNHFSKLLAQNHIEKIELKPMNYEDNNKPTSDSRLIVFERIFSLNYFHFIIQSLPPLLHLIFPNSSTFSSSQLDIKRDSDSIQIDAELDEFGELKMKNQLGNDQVLRFLNCPLNASILIYDQVPFVEEILEMVFEEWIRQQFIKNLTINYLKINQKTKAHLINWFMLNCIKRINGKDAIILKNQPKKPKEKQKDQLQNNKEIEFIGESGIILPMGFGLNVQQPNIKLLRKFFSNHFKIQQKERDIMQTSENTTFRVIIIQRCEKFEKSHNFDKPQRCFSNLDQVISTLELNLSSIISSSSSNHDSSHQFYQDYEIINFNLSSFPSIQSQIHLFSSSNLIIGLKKQDIDNSVDFLSSFCFINN